MASEGLHEPAEKLSAETIDYHRAMVSLMEELEAVDWYNQRVDATDDEDLAAVLAHNRDEEKEHAVMTLEWLRRRDPMLDQQLRTYLFTEGPSPRSRKRPKASSTRARQRRTRLSRPDRDREHGQSSRRPGVAACEVLAGR